MEKKGLPLGGSYPRAALLTTTRLADGGSSVRFVDKDKCTNCLICWVMCPDSAVITEDGKMIGFDLDHCKGCGICAVECPDKVKAIKMVEEAE